MEQCDKQFQFLKIRQRRGTCREDADGQLNLVAKADEGGTGCQLPKEKISLNLQNGCVSRLQYIRKVVIMKTPFGFRGKNKRSQ